MTEHSVHDEEEFVEDVVEATGVRAYLGGIVVALLTITVIVVVVRSGLIGHVGDEDRLRDTVEGAGVWTPLLFVGLMVVLVPLNVPGVLFVIPSTAMFGTAGGISLSLVGGFLASAVGVVAARRFGRKAFESRLPPRLRKLEQQISQRGFVGVALARCFTYLTQPVDWLCGLSSIPMRTVLAATFVGLIPPTVVIALSGGGILDLVL